MILAAVAVPATAASLPPPESNPCSTGLVFSPLPGQEFKGNDGNGFTLVKGDGVVVTNTTDVTQTLRLVLWSSASQVGTRLETSVGDLLLDAPKDGNRASTVLTMLPGESRTLRIVVAESKAEAHLIVDCSRFIFKAVR